MLVTVVSRNWLAAQGLAWVLHDLGVAVSTASPEDAPARAESCDLAVVCCEHWSAGGEEIAGALRERHVPFLVVAGHVDPGLRRKTREAGALDAFDREDLSELCLLIANLHWTARPQTRRFVLVNGLTVDLSAQRVFHGSRFFDLTHTECEILAALRDAAARDPDGAMSVAQLETVVWGAAGARSSATVRGYICRLRMKLDLDGAPCALLNGPRGGYRLMTEDACARQAARPRTSPLHVLPQIALA